MVPVGGVYDLAVLLARLLKDMLRHDKAMGYEPPEPVRDVKDIVVASVLVHGGHDLTDLVAIGGVIALPPVQECLVACSCGVEVVGASHRE